MIKLDAVTGLDLDLYNAVHPIREGYIFDDFSNWTPLTLMKKKKKKKSDALRDLIKFIKFLLTTSGNTVRIVRTDDGKECNNNFKVNSASQH